MNIYIKSNEVHKMVIFTLHSNIKDYAFQDKITNYIK